MSDGVECCKEFYRRIARYLSDCKEFLRIIARYLIELGCVRRSLTEY